jgi:glycosyltransferase involved in cell wall biosynthesis
MGTASRSILVVAHRFSLGFGGVPESILLLANDLATADVTVDVVCGDGFLSDVGRLKGLPTRGHALGFGELLKLDLRGYRAVFVTGAWNPIGLLLGIRARLSGVRLVYSPKGNLAWAEFRRPRDAKKFPYLMTLELLLLALSHRIIFSSGIERDEFILRPLFTGDAAIIPEPFRGSLAPQGARSVDPARLRFGFLAEIAPRKGLRELVKAFIEWQRAGQTSAELHIAGEPRPGSETYFQGVRDLVARAAAVPANIVWRGALRGGERELFYGSVDFLVCPTKFESFGLTPLEALWQGTPVIVTNNMGVIEFLSDHTSMIVLEDASEAQLLLGLRKAEAGRAAFLASAETGRLQSQPSLSGADLISRFLEEFGIERGAELGAQT